MAIRRPFAGKNIGEPLDGSAPAADQGQGQEQPVRAARLPLPTPVQPPRPAQPREMGSAARSAAPVAAAMGDVDRGSVERAKQVFANAGVDPSVVDKLVERSIAVDKEVEKIDLEIEKLRRRKAELVEEKQRIMRIIKALAQA